MNPRFVLGALALFVITSTIAVTPVSGNQYVFMVAEGRAFVRMQMPYPGINGPAELYILSWGEVGLGGEFGGLGYLWDVAHEYEWPWLTRTGGWAVKADPIPMGEGPIPPGPLIIIVWRFRIGGLVMAFGINGGSPYLHFVGKIVEM